MLSCPDDGCPLRNALTSLPYLNLAASLYPQSELLDQRLVPKWSEHSQSWTLVYRMGIFGYGAHRHLDAGRTILSCYSAPPYLPRDVCLIVCRRRDSSFSHASCHCVFGVTENGSTSLSISSPSSLPYHQSTQVPGEHSLPRQAVLYGAREVGGGMRYRTVGGQTRAQQPALPGELF